MGSLGAFFDACLTGHDHSYARTYQIIDGTAIEYGQDSATNPEGTLYIAAGSASGSKFYNLATQKQYYIAERSNNQLPTYSTIDFSDQAFTIKTFDYTGAEYAKPFTIKKESKKDSAQQLIKKAEGLSSSVYSEDSLKKVDDAVKVLKEIVASTSKDKGAEKLSALYDKTNNADNAKDPLNYYGYAQGDLDEKQVKAVKFNGVSPTTENVANGTYKMSRPFVLATKGEATGAAGNFIKWIKNSSNAKKIITKMGFVNLSQVKIAPRQIKLNVKSKITLKKGKKKTIKYTVYPANAVNKAVKFKSSNKKVAAVSKKGVIKAKKKGKATITITTVEGNVKAKIKVTVKKK